MNTPSLANPDGGDAFHVMFAAGELRILSLDELDEAFNSGKIDERTFVLSPGSTEWTRLGELLGLDEAPAAPAPVAQPATRSFVPSPIPSVIVAAPTIDLAAAALSTRPVAFDLDDEISAEHLRPKRRAPLVVAIAMVALGVGGFFAFKSANLSDAATVASAAAAAVPATPPGPVATPTTPTITPTVPVVAPIDDNHRVVLTDDQKRALAAADKAHATKAATQHAARAAAAAPHAKRSKEKVFHNGGNAYDPLNGKL